MLVQSDLQNGQQEPVERTEVAPLNLSPGSRWKNFIIEKRIGTGGFGIVYRALDTVLNRVVALKFLTTRDALQEGKLLAKVKDPGVVAVHSIEEESGATAICMEFVRGVDLENYLNQHGRRLHAMHAALIGRCLCRSLAAVHRVGLLHRDVKPRNVIASDDDRFVLVDFGLGVQIGSSTSDSAGTLHYMAPELLEKKQSTRSSDIYAVGVLLFYLVCGEYPVAGASAEDVLDAHRTGRRRHLADYVQVPPALENLIDRALARDPEQRFHSAGAMLAALDEILQDHPVRWRRKRTIYVAVGVLAAACSAVIVRQAVRPSEQGTAQQLNKYDGVYHELSLSDDGRVAAFSSDRAGNLDGDIWVEHPGRADAVPITGPGSNEHEAAISPDGTMVAYRSDRDNGAVYVNSTLGKHERLVAPYGRYPRFSPDGTRLAYWTGEEGNLSAPTAKTFVVPVSGGVPKQILPDFADCRFPVWSPDGKFLLITATRDKNVAPADGRDWWLVPVDEPGQPEELGLYPRLHSMSDRMHMNIRPHLYPPHWAGSQIVFGVHEGNLGKIWQVQIKSHRLSGDPTSITQGSTDDLSEPWNLADGTLAYSNFHSRINVWSLLLDSPESPEVRVTKAVDFELAPHVSADGQHLLFTRLVGNEYSTFFRDINATEPNSLSLPPGSTSINRAIISQDGQQIFYTAMMSSRQQVYEYALNSRDNRLICEKCGTPVDFFASQNKLLCTDDRRLTLVDPVKGDSLPLLQQDGHQFTDAAISPAGDRIAFVSRLDADHRQIFLANLHGTEVEPSEKWLEITTPNTWSDKPRWSPDGSKLYFFSTVDGFGCFYFQEFDGRGKPQGDVRALRHFHKIAKSTLELSQFALNLAVGGGKLFFTLDETSSNMWIQRMRIR